MHIISSVFSMTFLHIYYSLHSMRHALVELNQVLWSDAPHNPLRHFVSTQSKKLHLCSPVYVSSDSECIEGKVRQHGKTWNNRQKDQTYCKKKFFGLVQTKFWVRERNYCHFPGHFQKWFYYGFAHNFWTLWASKLLLVATCWEFQKD